MKATYQLAYDIFDYSFVSVIPDTCDFDTVLVGINDIDVGAFR